MKAGNLSDIEFRKMVISMLKELSENYNGMKNDIKNHEKTVTNEEFNI